MWRWTEEEPKVGLQRHRHFIGFYNVPFQASTRVHYFYSYSQKPAHFSRLSRRTWGYRGPILVINPWVPKGGGEIFTCIHKIMIINFDRKIFKSRWYMTRVKFIGKTKRSMWQCTAVFALGCDRQSNWQKEGQMDQHSINISISCVLPCTGWHHLYMLRPLYSVHYLVLVDTICTCCGHTDWTAAIHWSLHCLPLMIKKPSIWRQIP